LGQLWRRRVFLGYGCRRWTRNGCSRDLQLPLREEVRHEGLANSFVLEVNDPAAAVSEDTNTGHFVAELVMIIGLPVKRAGDSGGPVPHLEFVTVVRRRADVEVARAIEQLARRRKGDTTDQFPFGSTVELRRRCESVLCLLIDQRPESLRLTRKRRVVLALDCGFVCSHSGVTDIRHAITSNAQTAT
jgi:hypothetical protein